MGGRSEHRGTVSTGECAAAGTAAPGVKPEAERRRNPGIAALGWALTAIALGFVGWQLAQSGAWQLAGDRLERLAPAVLLGATVYAATSFLLAEAWRQLLAADACSVPAAAYHAVYGRTQIAKYLPGNLFHLAGRQILGRLLGHEQATLALASISEILLLLLVAAALAAPLLARWLSMDATVALALVALAAAAVLAIRPLLRAGARRDRWRARATRITAMRLCRAALLHAAFFVVAGALLWLLTLSAGGRDLGMPSLMICISSLALAWIAGFVTPGSSAGFGVREAVLIMTLQSSLDREAAVLVALAMRLVTLAGDLLFFAASLTLPLPGASSSTVSTRTF